MATPTVQAGVRAFHRTTRVADNAFQGTLSLDYANGQVISLSASSQQSSAFDATNERVVMVSVGGASTVLGAWISVGTNPTASAGAGSMWISQNAAPVPVIVPPGMLMAGLQGGAAGTLSMIPATFGAG